jgi:hypothetical protein
MGERPNPNSHNEKKNMAAREYAVMLGRDLQRYYGAKIVALYRDKHSMEQIIDDLDLQKNEYSGVATKTLINAISRALSGYDGSEDFVDVEPYPGLMAPEEVAKIQHDHDAAFGFNILTAFWGDRDQLWTDDEIQLTWELSEDLSYYRTSGRNRGPDFDKIAKKLNEEFHKGKPVRTGLSARMRLNRFKKGHN